MSGFTDSLEHIGIASIFSREIGWSTFCGCTDYLKSGCIGTIDENVHTGCIWWAVYVTSQMRARNVTKSEFKFEFDDIGTSNIFNRFEIRRMF